MIFNPISQLEIFLAIFAFIAITYLGLAVYLKDTNSWTNRFFFALAMILDIYVVVNIFSLHPVLLTPENQLFWIRMDLFMGAFIVCALFLLVHTFPKKDIQLKAKYLILLIIATLISAVLALTPFVFSYITYPNGVPTPIPGLLAPLYVLNIAGTILLSIILLIKRYIKSSGLNKMMFQYFLIGIAITFSLMVISNLLIPFIFKDSNFVFLGPIYPIILMLFIGYAIVKYHFLDIQPIIARAVSYILVVGVLIALYSALIFYGSNKIFGVTFNIPTLLVSILLAFTFIPLSRLIRRMTDHLFFKGIYDADKILADLTHVITSTINFNELSENLLSTIIKEMRVTKVAILLITDDEITSTKSIGYDNNISLNDKRFVSFVRLASVEGKRFFVISDLENEESKNLFRTHDVEALFPIWARGKIVAFIILGPKLSGTTYSAQDLNLLDVFASESGIAIANSRLYTDLKTALDSKSKFISVVSHQLRTPVSGIRWGLETLKGKNDALEQKKIVDTSYEKVIFLSDQLDDILIALDVITRDMSLQKVKCNIAEMCQQITKEFEATITLNKLQIIYDISESAGVVDADFSKLKKILKVIIKNAVVYSPVGSSIHISSKIEENSGQKKLIIMIEDSGLGITDEEKPRVFEQFFRGERARIKLPDGLGLGMYISKIFARAHGGDVTFLSKGQDEGSTFYVSLPFQNDSASAIK